MALTLFSPKNSCIRWPRSLADPLFLFAILLLSGCASIPLSTMIHLSGLSPESLARIDPAGVEVKVSAPSGWQVDIDSARLTLTVVDSSGSSRTSKMKLRLLQSSRGSRDGGFFSSDVPVMTYRLARPATPHVASGYLGSRLQRFSIKSSRPSLLSPTRRRTNT
ncbi:MAG TPA: hypothetical protein VFG73_09025 [Rhodanobacteraceae bacterium]|nr:hypothetical protein [Rhodanobacteraceae bacterium]